MAVIVVTQDNTTVYVGNNDIVKIQIPGGGTVTIKALASETVSKFTIDFIGDDESDVAKVDLATFSENDLQIDVKHYDPTDEVALMGGFNMGVDPDNDAEFAFSYIGATGNTFNGYVNAKDGGEKDFTAEEKPLVVCFAEGTIVETDIGPRPIETVMPGDLLVTLDNGLQPVRWIGKRRLDSIDLMRHPQLAPVRVAAGTFGDHIPFRDLVLSPQHRVLIADWRADYLFAQSKVLVAVKHLIDGQDIAIDRTVSTVCYYHLLFDQHEIVLANGVPAESLHLGDMAMDALDTGAQSEVNLLFPDLSATLKTRETAEMLLKSFEAQAVCAYA